MRQALRALLAYLAGRWAVGRSPQPPSQRGAWVWPHCASRRRPSTRERRNSVAPPCKVVQLPRAPTASVLSPLHGPRCFASGTLPPERAPRSAAGRGKRACTRSIRSWALQQEPKQPRWISLRSYAFGIRAFASKKVEKAPGRHTVAGFAEQGQTKALYTKALYYANPRAPCWQGSGAKVGRSP